MFEVLLALFCLFAIFLALLTCCCCAIGSAGAYRMVQPLLRSLLHKKHDHAYSREEAPLNSECYICLEKPKDEVVTTCNHSFCGR